MGFSGGDSPVFIDTNLGTHLAFAVHPDITTGNLKSILRLEHSSCFPDFGEITIHAVMVKRKTCLYHLPEPMPIKIACEGMVGAWFLCVDASQLKDIPREAADVHFPLQKLSSSRLLKDCGDKSRKATTLQGNLTRDNTSDVINCSTSENNIRFADKYIKSQVGKCGRDYFVCSEARLEMRSVPVFTQGVARQTNAEVFVSTNVTPILKSISDLNHEEDNQVRNSTTIAESAPVAKNDDNLVVEHILRNKGDMGSFSICETLNRSSSEKSIAGIISRYFPDFDEVNFGSTQPKDTRDTMEMTRQSEGMQTFKETELNENTGCTTEIAVPLVYDKSLNKTNESDLGTTGSSNVIASDVKQITDSLAGRRCRKLNKNKKFTFARNTRGMNINRKARKATRFAVSDEYRSCQSHDKVSPNASHSTLKMPFDIGVEASSSKIDRCKIGGRLIRAANSIVLSVSGKKPQKSVFISRSGILSTDKSTELVRKIAFEISDSDH